VKRKSAIEVEEWRMKKSEFAPLVKKTSCAKQNRKTLPLRAQKKEGNWSPAKKNIQSVPPSANTKGSNFRENKGNPRGGWQKSGFRNNLSASRGKQKKKTLLTKAENTGLQATEAKKHQGPTGSFSASTSWKSEPIWVSSEWMWYRSSQGREAGFR